MLIKKKYKSVGFVELLIAMGVASVALVVFLSMATNSFKEVVRYERHDALTRLAMNSALVVRRHVEESRDPSVDDFPTDLSVGQCYEINFNTSTVSFISRSPDVVRTDATIAKHDIVYDRGSISVSEEAYVAWCINDVETSSRTTLYNGVVMTGYVNNFEDVGEYEYPLIIIVRDYAE